MFIWVLLLAAGVSGCGEPRVSKQPDAQASTGQLPVDRTFRSVAVTDGGADRPLAAGSRIALEFRPGEIRAEAGCNHMFGRAALRGDRLVVDGLGQTEMACEPELMEQDTWLGEFLTGEPSFTLDGDTLRLSSGDVVIELLDREVADPDRPLLETRWTVTTLIDGSTTSSVPRGADAYLTFGEDGTVGGDTGCNMFTASFTVHGSTITVTELKSTLRACVDEGRRRLADTVVELLGSPMTYEIKADQLKLSGGSAGLALRAS